MKTIYILLLFILGCSFHLVAQYEYYDALKIRKYSEMGYRRLTPKQREEYAIMLTRANPFKIDSTKIDTIVKRFVENNKFLNEVINISLGSTGAQGNRNWGNSIISSSSPIASIGGIDVTNIANGVAMLMIDRAKQELTISFFNRFQAYAEKHPEFQVLFPKTTNNLVHLLSYKYPEMLPVLRTGFFEDIDKLPLHLDDVLELPKYKDLLANFPEIRVAIKSVRLIQEIETGQSNAAEILTQFASFKEWSQPNTSDAFFNFGNTVKLADIISQSLRYRADSVQINADSVININNDTIITLLARTISRIDRNNIKTDSLVKLTIRRYKYSVSGTGAGAMMRDTAISDTQISISSSKNNDDQKRIWITPEQAKELIEDDTLFRIYIGLVLERVKAENIEWRTAKDTISFANVMNENATHIFLFQNKVAEFITLANAIDKVTDSLSAKIRSGTAFTEDNYYDYIDGSMNVIEYAFSFASLFDSTLKVSEYTAIARKANDLYRHIYKQEYTQALTDAIGILEMSAKMIDSKQYTSLLQSMQRDSIADLSNAIRKGELNNKERDTLIKIAATNTALKAGINKVLMADSARDKLDKLITVLADLNKYGLFMANMIDAQTPEEVQDVLDNAILPVGSSSIKKSSCWNASIQSYLGAYYRFAGKDHAVNNAWDDRFGVTAPIGISVSHGFNKLGSLSLFVSLFDIGAIVDYQLQKDTVITSATQSGTAIQKDYSIKLQQIISPGFYLVYGCGANLPLALGAGAQYGPGLGKIDLGTNNLLERNPSWRFNVFLAVDLPFFNLWNVTKGYNFKK